MDSADPVQLQSPCGVQTARKHHAALFGALRARDAIEIDAAWFPHVDLTFIQLLASATRPAKASQTRLLLISVSTPLRRVRTRAGLRLSPSGDQITWA